MCINAAHTCLRSGTFTPAIRAIVHPPPYPVHNRPTEPFIPSTLPLLVAPIPANHTHSSLTTYYLAVSAKSLDGCSYFHFHTHSVISARHTCTAISFQIRFLQKAFVLVRHQMGLYLSHEIHRHNDDNQKRSSAEIKWHIPAHNHELWKQTNKRNVSRSEHCQSRHHSVDIPGSLLPRTPAWYKCAGFAQIVSGFLRVKHQGRIKETKEDNRSSVKHDINRLSRLHRRRQIPQPRHAFRTSKPTSKSTWKENNAGRKNRRNNSGHVQLQR